MVLNIEQHQSAVAKRVDGPQDKGCNQGGEERAPQRLEREVVAHLEDRERLKSERMKGLLVLCIRVFTPRAPAPPPS